MTIGRIPKVIEKETAVLTELKIATINVGTRHRKDMGDLRTLAESIREEGLLQPIGVTSSFDLIFGERRLRAVRDVLKRKTILARIVDVRSLLRGEYAENEVRKDFTASERVAIGKAIESQVGNRQGQRTDRELVQNLAQVAPGTKTRDLAAKKAGFGNPETYRQAAKVVQNGTPTLVHAMDQGKVSISAAAILVDADPNVQEAILELDAEAIVQAAKEIRKRQAERRAEFQQSKTVTPKQRPSEERRRATRLIHGDCRLELEKLKNKSVDLILTDPPYPNITREYGKMTEAEWHEMMRVVVKEGQRILKPTGSMVIILQPNFEKIGTMRLWMWEFLIWAAKEWNLIQDAYWWNFGALPTMSATKKFGLLRSSMKMCVWLGPPTCYRNQENVLCLPSDQNFSEYKSDSALRRVPSGLWLRKSRIRESVVDRGGSTPFNLLPVAAGLAASVANNPHPAQTPYDVAAWWVKYLLPPNGVLLDCFSGSGTMLAAGLDFGASQVIGIEREKRYLKITEKRVLCG